MIYSFRPFLVPRVPRIFAGHTGVEMQLPLLVFALIQSSQLDWIQKLLDLRFGQDLFFADNFQRHFRKVAGSNY
jgi:hypothetical protein